MKCPECNKENPEGNTFCNFCGKPIQQKSVRPPPPKSKPINLERAFSVNVLKYVGLVGIIIASIIIMTYLFKEWEWIVPFSIFIAGVILIVIAELIIRHKKYGFWGKGFEVAGVLVIFISIISCLILNLISDPVFYTLTGILTLIIFIVSFISKDRDSFYTLGLTAAFLIFLNLEKDGILAFEIVLPIIIVIAVLAMLIRVFLKKNREIDYFSAIFPYVAIASIGVTLEYNPETLLPVIMLFSGIFLPELLKEKNFKYSTFYFFFTFLAYFITTVILGPSSLMVLIFIIAFTCELLICFKPYIQVRRTILFFTMIFIMVIAGTKSLEHLSLDILNAVYIVLFTVMGIFSIKKYAQDENEKRGFEVYFRFLYGFFYFLMLFHLTDWVDKRCSLLLLLIPICYFTVIYIFDWSVDSFLGALLLFAGSIAVFFAYSVSEHYWIGNLVIALSFYALSLIFKNREKSNIIITYIGTLVLMITAFEKFDFELGATLSMIPLALIFMGYGIFYKKAFLRISGIVLILFALIKGLIFDTNILDSNLQIGFGIFLVGLSMIGISYLYLKYPKFIMGDDYKKEEDEDEEGENEKM